MANCSKDMGNYVKLRKRSGGCKLTKRTFQLFNKDIFGIFSKFGFYLWWEKRHFFPRSLQGHCSGGSLSGFAKKCPKAKMFRLINMKEKSSFQESSR